MPTDSAQYQLLGVDVADDPEAWSAAGFVVADARVRIGSTAIVLNGAHGRDARARGITGVHIAGLAESADLDGLALVDPHRVDGANDGDDEVAGHLPEPADHPNGINAIDHLVVMTPDCDRTTAAFEAAGLEARRSRRFPTGDRTTRQTFFWLGDVILELVGDDEAHGEGEPQLWGLALTAPDLDATVDHLGDRTSPAKDAVQRGRQISTIDGRALGISVPIAVMSPHQRGAPAAPDSGA